MKKFAITLIALASIGSCMAQLAEVSTPQRLLEGVQSDMYYPVLSRDGSKLLFSDSDYSRLRLYDFNDNVTVSVSDAARSGFEARFTADSNSVEFISQTTDRNGLNYRTPNIYSISDRRVRALAEPARRAVLAASANKGVSVSTEGSTLYINGSAFSPVECHAGYLWESVSPDGTKVMFVAAGKGVFVCDLQGNIVARLGKYEAPVWYGNDHVVAMRATDDGHQFSSSQIVLMDLNGTIQSLTRPESMTMYPTASIEAGKVVYNTIDGRLYQLNVKLQ